MVSNDMMFRLSREIATAERRTRYAVQHTGSKLWLATNRKWLAREHAMQFETMTAALAFAVMEMGYGLDQFTVEVV